MGFFNSIKPFFGIFVHTIGNYDHCLCKEPKAREGDICKECKRQVAYRKHAAGRQHRRSMQRYQATFLLAIHLFIVALGFCLTNAVFKYDLSHHLESWKDRFDAAHKLNLSDIFVKEQTDPNWCYYAQLVTVNNLAHYEFDRVPCDLEHIFWKKSTSTEKLIVRITNFGVGWFKFKKHYYRGFGLDIARNNILLTASSFQRVDCSPIKFDDVDEYAINKLENLFEHTRINRRYYMNIKKNETSD